MSANRWCTLLALGWVGLGLMLGVEGCQLPYAMSDMENAQADSITRNMRTTNSGATIQQVGYQGNPGPGNPNGMTTLPNPVVTSSPSTGAMPGAPMTMPSGPSCGPNGCGGGDGSGMPDGMGGGRIPTEREMVSHPPYVIEPPDILLLQPIRMIPKPPYTVGPLDVLLIRLAQPRLNEPLEGTYSVSPDGSIDLGYSYGRVAVGGLTLEDVLRVIRARLIELGMPDPKVAVGLAQFRSAQQVRGEHLVRQDGTIHLGSYGCVYVTGLTLAQAKVAIERHLSQFLQDPEVSVDVGVYNSKAYYIITDGAGYGQSVFRLPIKGNETVLDAISSIQGLPAVASTKKIWLARPAPPNHGCSQILPVDWGAITQAGVTATNYQIFPGDRIFVKSDPLICIDNNLAKILAPVERLLGLGLLGASLRNSLNGTSNGTAFIAPLR